MDNRKVAHWTCAPVAFALSDGLRGREVSEVAKYLRFDWMAWARVRQGVAQCLPNVQPELSPGENG